MKKNKDSQSEHHDVLPPAIDKGVSILEFDASWCKPCKEQRIVINKLENQYRGRVSVFKLDVDRHPGPAMSMGVTSIPTLIVFKNGDEITRFIGKQSEATLMQSLEAALEEG